MSDFHQGGVITTLHRLGSSNLDSLERDLEKAGTIRPVALVLPCLASIMVALDDRLVATTHQDNA